MPYSTGDDLIKLMPALELARLTAESGDEPDAAVVAEAISKADGEINAYIGVRYRLPLTTVPDVVKSMSVDIAIHHLYTRRGIENAVRRAKYDDAVKFLQKLVAGQAHLEGADGLEEAGAAELVTEVSSAPRVFDRDKLGGF